MDNNSQDFPYSEEEYQGWKNARKPGEDDSKQAYVKWRIDRDKKIGNHSPGLYSRA